MCEAFQITATEHAEPGSRCGRLVTRSRSRSASTRERMRRFAGGLHALGVGRGDTVGLMLVNRPEFHLLDAAAMHLGAIPFSIYNTSSAEQIAYLLRRRSLRGGDRRAGLRARAWPRPPRETGTVDAHDPARRGPRRDDRPGRARGARRRGSGLRLRGDAGAPSAPDDVLTLIYTSGTTGPPKGVQLTHANELAQCRGSGRGQPLAPRRLFGDLVPAQRAYRRPGAVPTTPR